MKCTLFSTMLAVICFAACSPGVEKKVKIMSSGKLTVDPATKVVTQTAGTQHNEEELILTEKDKGVTVKGPDGEHVYEVPDAGVYVLNLKADTLIGNIVNFGEGRTTSITTEQLEHIIDSTQQLINGQNASDEKKTYFLVPKTIKKLSSNPNAQVINPYNNIPGSVAVDKDGKAPEIFKFFTARQKRESLNELIERMKK
jgi:hypothetical protein